MGRGFAAECPGSVGSRQVIVAAGERANVVAQMEWSGTSRRQIGLFEVAYTDFAELLYADETRKAYLMPIIGYICKLAYGWAVGKRANADLALQPWEVAKVTFQQRAIPYAGMIVHHDQDSVYTGYRWTGQLLLKDGVRLSYTLNGAKNDPEMESFNGRLRTEGRSLFLDPQTPSELWAVVGKQMYYYNTERRHSSIDYLSPLTYIECMRSGFPERVLS